MSKRATSRKLAVINLYQAEIRVKDIQDIFTLPEKNYKIETVEFAKQLAFKTWEKRVNIDPIIVKYTKNWDIERINIIEKSILRLAIYELRFTETPTKIVLNEALELAKNYCSDTAVKFINGILDAFVKQECLLV